MERESDEVLLRLAREGVESAFSALFRRHRAAIFRFAYRLGAPVAAAEDIVQECFFSILRRPWLFDPARANLRAYLYGAARNLAIKRLRDRGEVELSESPDPAAPGGPEQEAIDRERAEAVRRAVLALPLAQREALALVEYEGMSLEEAAQILRIDAGAVKSRLHRARENLRRSLAPYAGVRERTKGLVL